MAEKYIVNMPLKTTPDDTDLMIIEDAQDTKRMTWANITKPIRNMIGNLASLTTTHKTTVVGAINELQANNSLLNVTSQFTVNDPDVARFLARRQGNVIFIRFSFKPSATGFTNNIISVPAGLVPDGVTSFAISTITSSADVSRTISAAIRSNGEIAVVAAGTLPTYDLEFSTSYIIP